MTEGAAPTAPRLEAWDDAEAAAPGASPAPSAPEAENPRASEASRAQAEEPSRAAAPVQDRSERAHPPRPLAAFLSAGAAHLQQGVLLAPRLGDPRFPWRPELKRQVAELAADLGPFASGAGPRARAAERDGAAAPENGAENGALNDPQPPSETQIDERRFSRAVMRVGLDGFDAALDGLERYMASKPVRRPSPAPTVWSAGSCRLLDYGALTPSDQPRPTVVALPSLINRPRILDLLRSRSLMRALAARGVRPLLLDWGDPGLEERGFTMGDHVLKRVGAALQMAAALGDGRPPALLGHCLGGTLAIAAAQVFPARVAKLVLLGAPWTFMDGPAARGRIAGREESARLIETCGRAFGGVPPEFLNTLFFARDPLQPMRKFPGARGLKRSEISGKLFIAIEDWLNDGVLLPAPAARELFVRWAFEDAPARGGWRVDGAAITLDRVRAPALVAASARDSITPLSSAMAAFEGLRDARLLEPSGGHVGMIVGERAEKELWDPLAAWLRA